MNMDTVTVVAAVVAATTLWAFSDWAPRNLKIYQRFLLVLSLGCAAAGLYSDGMATSFLIEWARTPNQRIRPGLLESIAAVLVFTMFPSLASGVMALLLRRNISRWLFLLLITPSMFFVGWLGFWAVRDLLR